MVTQEWNCHVEECDIAILKEYVPVIINILKMCNYVFFLGIRLPIHAYYTHSQPHNKQGTNTTTQDKVMQFRAIVTMVLLKYSFGHHVSSHKRMLICQESCTDSAPQGIVVVQTTEKTHTHIFRQQQDLEVYLLAQCILCTCLHLMPLKVFDEKQP